MNILFITENFFPDVMGGSGRVVAETTKRLAARGHNIHVLTKLVDGASPTETVNGANITRYSASSFGVEELWSVWRAIATETKKAECEVALICQPLPGLAALHHPRLRNVPKIRDFYGPWHEEYRVKETRRSSELAPSQRMGYLARKWIDSHVLKGADAIRVLSVYTAGIVAELCADAGSRVRVISGGVDTERFAPASDKRAIREKMGLPKDKKIVFTVRNLTSRMGLDVLIEAMGLLAAGSEDVLLVIGGEGPLRQTLEDMIRSMNLGSCVSLRGRIPDNDLPAFYQSADLFVLPTQDLEGFGLVTLEAMACGLPVLATPQGGTVEILKACGNEFLLDGMDSAGMASRISELLARPERMAELGKKARETAVALYSWDREVDLLLELFEDMKASASRRAG